MAITSYSELKAAIPEWAERNDYSDVELSEFVQLAEARLNREIKETEATADLTGTVSVRTIDISPLPFIAPVSLKIMDSPMWQERDIDLKSIGEMNFYEGNRYPQFYTVTPSVITFNALLDQPYEFRFIYRARFALSDSAPTNALLTDHPDIYLAAVLVWSGIKVSNERLAMWKSVLEEGIPEVKNVLAQSRRGVLTPDPMFSRTSRPGIAGWENWRV